MNLFYLPNMMTGLIKKSLAGICLLSLGLSNALARDLIGLDYSVMSGNAVQLVFTFNEEAIEPRTFTIDEPARIALDFADTENRLQQRNLQVGIGNIRSIISAAAKGRTRVVINLSQKTDFNTSVSGNQTTLTLAGSDQNAVAVDSTQTTTASIISTPPGIAKGVTNIDFKRGPNGEGRIILDLTSTSISTDVWRENNNVHVELVGAELPDELQRRMDVSDFATPISHIDAIQDGANIHLTISSNGDFDHLAYQTDRVYTIEVAPISKEEEENRKKKKFGYTGERLSLNFQDIEVRSVLQLLADFTGLNLVVSDSVEGNLTLRLKNVPWDQAMDIILKTKGLAQRRAGNVILIAPTDEIAAREKLELESRKQVEELERLRTEFIKVNYAKAENMAELLNQKDNSILSPRGSVSVDIRTNTLLVKDTNSSLLSVRQLLTELDIPVRQVLIESRVVIANDDFSKELGVRFGVTSTDASPTPGNVGADTSGSFSGITDGTDGGTFTLGAGGLNTNLPVQNPAGTFALALAKLPLGTLLEMELSAAQIEGRGEVVSSPRVITADAHTARIEQGIEIPYLELNNGDATLQFRKAVLSLEVTPQITPDDRVIMDLDVHKDSQGENVSFGQGLSAPTIDTREVQSQLLVENGQTVVLGGIYETIQSTQVTRVPFFSDIPIIGNLFKSSSTVDDRSELLIFVTPKILQGANLEVR